MKMHDGELEKHRAPAIWFRRQTGKGSLSKLGGLPTLPSGVEWPRHRQTRTPLHFLAQIDLSHLPPTPLESSGRGPALPKSGLLFFFADMEEEMLWGENGGPFAATRVIFTDRGRAEREPPEDIPDIFHAVGEMDGGYNTGIKVYPDASLEPHVIDTFGGIETWPTPDDSYAAAAESAMVASIESAIGALPVFEGASARSAIKAAEPREYIVLRNYEGKVVRELRCPRHQMLGVGKNLQGTAEEARARGDVLLLQIDSDIYVHRHFIFCDMGAAQFWIKPSDLARSRFDKAWATTEGG
jgi:uncharacterized protein YwqG